MASIFAVPCHIWSHISHVVTLVNRGHTCHICHMYSCPNKYPNICILPYLSLFPRESLILVITLSGMLLLLRRYFSWAHIFLRKSHFTVGHKSQEFTFPGNSHYPQSHMSQDVTFPWKSHFPGSHNSWEATFPGM